MSTWGGNSTSAAGMNVTEGNDYEEIETDDLGFQPVEIVAGDKIKFFHQAWPADRLPPPTASLLSIASSKGVLAAAGPDTLVIVQTEILRQQYIPRRRKKLESKGVLEDEPKVKLLEQHISLTVPRVSHVAFSSDENCLVIAAEQGGGLAIYNTNTLSAGAQPAFQIGTNGVSVRHLLPNPSPAPEFAHLVAIVLSNGQLLLADLKQQSLVQTESGSPIFYQNVFCAAWSKLGKQIIAGLEDGTGAQIDRSGAVKDKIPHPPRYAHLRQEIYAAASALPIASISWLSTHEFLIIYSPVNPPQGDDLAEDSTYFFAFRQPKQGWTFRKLAIDPCTAFNFHRSKPAGHAVQRLYEWAPDLKDLLILTSSAGMDVGLISNFNSTNEYAVVSVQDESRRPTLPLNQAGDDTTAVGIAIDLSAKDLPPKPVPSQVDVIEEAPGPVPALCLLNTEGELTMWWIIYSESIRKHMPYHGMVHKSGPYRSYSTYLSEPSTASDIVVNQDTSPTSAMSETTSPNHTEAPKLSAPTSLFASSAPSPFGSSNSSQQSTFGKPAFGGATALGQGQSAWGSSGNTTNATAAPAFGKPSFGASTAMGAGTSSSNPTTSVFGKPAFGNTTSMGGTSTFGQASGVGASRASPWSTPTAQQPPSLQSQSSSSAFTNASTTSPFAAIGSTAGNASAFSTFSSNSGSQASPFAMAAQQNSNAQSPFTTATKQNAGLSRDTSMLSTATLGSPSSSFSFTQVSPLPGSATGSFLSKSTLSNEATMTDHTTAQPSTQPGGLSSFGSSGFKLGSLFSGDGTAKNDLPKPKYVSNRMFGTSFETSLDISQKEKPSQATTPIKEEPTTEDQSKLNSIPAFKPSQPSKTPEPKTALKAEAEPEIVPEPAPLPPAWSAAKSTTQGIPDDAPLPPFPSDKTVTNVDKDPFPEIPRLGSEDEQPNSFDEVSDEDVSGEDYDEESDADEEEDGEEADEEEEDVEETYQVENPKALSAFESRLQPPDSAARQVKNPSTTPPSHSKFSYTPAGAPPSLGKGPTFPPPAAEPLRSPSPARAALRSVTNPIPCSTSGGLPAQIKQGAIPPAPVVRRQAPPPPPPEPDIGQLEDEADDRVKALLSAPIEPDKALPAFHTHQDYARAVQIVGIGGQIEKVYRDINSMVDVLGLNARSLASFVEGHKQLTAAGQRTREELENEELWTLSEISSMGTIIGHLEEQLRAGQLDNAKDITRTLRQDENEVLKIKAKAGELKKLVAARTDPEQMAIQHSTPLPAEVLAQQVELRQSAQKVQKLLSEIEKKTMILRADLASLSSGSDTSSGLRTRAPTMEAVMRTIQKLTLMVQERSGDIDVLEAQIRQLPSGLASVQLAEDYEDELVSRLGHSHLLGVSANGSPSRSTPLMRRSRMANNGEATLPGGVFRASTSSQFTTPTKESARHSRSVFSPQASALAKSTGSVSGSARKKMTDVTAEEVYEYKAKTERRRAVFDTLKGKLESRGVRTVKAE